MTHQRILTHVLCKWKSLSPPVLLDWIQPNKQICWYFQHNKAAKSKAVKQEVRHSVRYKCDTLLLSAIVLQKKLSKKVMFQFMANKQPLRGTLFNRERLASNDRGKESCWESLFRYLRHRDWGSERVVGSVTSKNRQMSIKVPQKWFHYKNYRFWHLYKSSVRM